MIFSLSRVTWWAPATLLLLVPAACSPFADEAPPVADSVMVEVLADLHLLDARIALGDTLSVHARDSVLARHGLDPGAYMEAIHYYTEHPDLYVEIYGRALDHLEQER